MVRMALISQNLPLEPYHYISENGAPVQGRGLPNWSVLANPSSKKVHIYLIQQKPQHTEKMRTPPQLHDERPPRPRPYTHDEMGESANTVVHSGSGATVAEALQIILIKKKYNFIFYKMRKSRKEQKIRNITNKCKIYIMILFEDANWKNNTPMNCSPNPQESD